jgi:diguanylate cyclase (GGDEF)-like protein
LKALDERQHKRFALRMVVLFAILGALMTVVAVQVYRTVGELVSAAHWVSHTHRVREEIASTVLALRTAEAAQRAYVVSSDASRLADSWAALPAMAEHAARLPGLVGDNPPQLADAQRLARVLEQRRETMARTLESFQQGGLEALRAGKHLARAREQDAEVDAIAAAMNRREQDVLAGREAASEKTAWETRALTIAAMSLCIAMLAIALLLILREQGRSRLAEKRAQASTGDLARSLEESRRLADTLHRLSDLGHMLQGCRSFEEAMAGLQTLLDWLFPGASGGLYLLNPSQNLMTLGAAWGDLAQGDTVFAPDDCWAVRLGHPYPENDATGAFACRHLPQAALAPGKAHLCVPLFAQGGMLGILLLLADSVTPEARNTAIAAGEQISLAIANLRLQDTLRTQSLRDPLTGLFNRRYLEVSLARDLARAIRRSQPLAVLMLDIDHFKTFNDTHGHDGGDALLAQVGEILLGLVRSEDVACRYGGEEFTIVVQEADAALALDRAEAIRSAIASLAVVHRHQALGRVTASIGIASYPQHGDTPEQLLKRADRALYTAKHAGRNRVCVADRL